MILNLKQIHMKQFSILAFILLATSSLSAQTGAKNFIDQPFIEVRGKAEMEVVPDIIYLKVIIDEKDSKTKTSMEDQENNMLKVLESIGLNIKKDVAVVDYASNFESHWIKRTNIQTSKEYEVLVNSGKMVAQVFIELEKLDISNITVSKLDHSKMEEFRQEVKVNAAKAAKTKAQKIMEAFDQITGKAIYVQEVNRNIYPARMNAMDSNMMMKVKSNASASGQNIPDIEFQKLKLEYEILARFAIE